MPGTGGHPDPKHDLDTLVETIAAGDPETDLDALEHVDDRSRARDVSDADREALLTFADELAVRRTQTGYHRQTKLLRHCAIIAEETGLLAESLDSERAAKRIVNWIHDAYHPDGGTRGTSEETNKDYRVALKGFGRRVSSENGDDPPDSMTWISSGLPSAYDPSPNPAEMLRWDEDVHPMLDACRSSRDRALIALQMDAGLRSGELHHLRAGAFADSKYSLKLHVGSGKTGERSIDLIPSIPYVRKWLDDHPARHVADAPLWTTESSTPDDYNEIAYHSFYEVFERAALRADVSKPYTPTNFRKSNAAWLARTNAPQSFIEDRQGRTRGSEHIGRYVARFGPEAERVFAELNGLDVESGDQPDRTGPIECPRCARETPRHEPLCVFCGQALSPSAAEDVDTAREDLFESVAETTDEETIALLRQVHDAIEDDPEALADLIGDD